MTNKYFNVITVDADIVYKHSFWFKSRLALNILLAILFLFAEGLTVSECKKMLKTHVSTKSIVQWYNYFRDICTTYFSNNPVRFRNTCVIHIDETAISGK